MHLVTFIEANHIRLGVWDQSAGEILDVCQVDPTLPSDMLSLIEQGEAALQKIRAVVASGAGRLPISRATLLAPIPRPLRNIICVGKNYRDHVNEVQSALPNNDADAIPQAPIFFTKATTSVIGPNEPIPASRDETASADYEGELAVVIGRGGRDISRAQAWAHIFGYTIINDVTSRRLQKRHQQWFLGKSLDGFCPLGSAIVTAEAIGDVSRLRIETRVNGELRQQGCVEQMIFDIPEQIATLSKVMSLLPGDIIATGTPAGVGMGFKPPRFLQPGDEVAITIEPIGTLVNKVT